MYRTDLHVDPSERRQVEEEAAQDQHGSVRPQAEAAEHQQEHRFEQSGDSAVEIFGSDGGREGQAERIGEGGEEAGEVGEHWAGAEFLRLRR